MVAVATAIATKYDHIYDFIWMGLFCELIYISVMRRDHPVDPFIK